MGAIILSILSVIGWILLFLLIILVVAMLLILFYPVTYQIKGHKNEQETILQCKINWLFHLVRFRYLYPAPGKPQCKILFWDLLNPKSKAKTKKSKKKKLKKHSQEQAESKPVSATDSEHPKSVNKSSLDTVNAPTAIHDSAVADVDIERNSEASAETIDDLSEQDCDNKDSENSDQKLNLLERIQKAVQQFIDKIKNLIDKIQKIRNNITYYTDLLQDKTTKAILSRVFQKIGKILKHSKPRKIKADLLVGTGSPDTTGYMMGLYGVLSPHIGRKVIITPDFTQAILQGEFEIKGHITILVITINLIKIALDKELRQLIKKLKNGGNQNG